MDVQLTFGSLALAAPILKALEDVGYRNPYTHSGGDHSAYP